MNCIQLVNSGMLTNHHQDQVAVDTLRSSYNNDQKAAMVEDHTESSKKKMVEQVDCKHLQCNYCTKFQNYCFDHYIRGIGTCA